MEGRINERTERIVEKTETKLLTRLIPGRVQWRFVFGTTAAQSPARLVPELQVRLTVWMTAATQYESTRDTG